MATNTRNIRWWLVLAILACAGLYLVGNGRVPLWDRDEGWYAQCSKEMWETGDWVVPKFLGDLRTEKPVFVYWLQLGGYWLFGGPSEFAVRFYAAVAQTIVLVILGVSFWKMAGPLRGAWTAFIYGTCAMAIIAAKMCLTDATMMVFLMTAQMCLMAMYLGYFRWWSVLVLFVSLGFAGLTKGPVALVPSAFTLLALGIMDHERLWPIIRPDRGQSWERIIKAGLVVLGGLVITVSVSAPWLVLLHQRAPEWLPRTLNMAGQHLRTPLEGHTGPFGYYMLLVWGTFFPWSVLIPTAAYVAWKQRHVPQTRFAIAAFLGPWLFFEIMKTKLPHYVLPTFPFLAFMLADALVRCTRSQYLEMYKPRLINTMLVWALVIGVLGAAPIVFGLPTLNFPPISWFTKAPDLHFGPQPWLAIVVLAVTGYVFTAGTWWWFRQRRPYMAAGWMGGGFVAFIAIFYGWYLPQAKFMQLSYQVAQVIRANGGGADKLQIPGEIVSLVYPQEKETIGYQEPTLPFYQGGTLRLKESNNYLVKTPPSEWPKMMVLTSEIWNQTPKEIQNKLVEVGRVHGLAYADGGKIYDVIVVKPALAWAWQ